MRPPVRLPRRLAELVKGAGWSRLGKGLSGDRIYLVHPDKDMSWVMKIMDRRRFATHRVADEAKRLKWLAGKLPVPQVVWCGRDSLREFLLTTRVPGRNCNKPGPARRVLVRELARALRMVHSLPIHDCPFDATLDARLADIKRYIERRAVSRVFEDEDGRIWQPSVYLRYLSYTRPDGEDLVFTHGDFCHPNVLLKDGALSGIVDWTYAGVADRHQDLAWIGFLIRERCGKRWLDAFMRGYGLGRLDPVKMQYYLALNEVYWSVRADAAARVGRKLHA